MSIDELLERLVSETKYTINYYGDNKFIKEVHVDELPERINIEACFEDVAEFYFTKCDSVEAQVIDNTTKKVVAKYDLQ